MTAAPSASRTVCTDAFLIPHGDPDVIRALATLHTGIARAAGTARTQLWAVDTTSTWTGAEGDAFRARQSALLEPLRIAEESYRLVGDELHRFAGALDAAQRQITRLANDHDDHLRRLPVPGDGTDTSGNAVGEAVTYVARAATIRAAVEAAAAACAYAIASAPSPPDIPELDVVVIPGTGPDPAGPGTRPGGSGRTRRGTGGPPGTRPGRGFGPRTPTDPTGPLLVPRDLHRRSRAEQRRYWNSLTPAQRAAAIEAHPELFGNLPGVPAADRDRANRLTVDRENVAGEERFRRAGIPAPTCVEDLERLTNAQKERLGMLRRRTIGGVERYEATSSYHDIKGALDRYAGALAVRRQCDTPPPDPGQKLMVLAYQPGEFGNKGRTMLSYGNPETADNVAVLVPGMFSRTSAISDSMKGIRNLQRQARQVDPTKTTCVILDQGYDAPGGPDVVSGRQADEGGRRIAADLQDIAESRRGRGPLTLVAHSYGTTTAGFALSRHGAYRHVDDVVLLGSPGTGRHTSNVGDLHMTRDHVFAGSNSHDPVTTIYAGHGGNPAMDHYGATRIRAEDTPRPGDDPTPGVTDVHDHLRYLDTADGVEGHAADPSLRAVGDIVTGHADRLQSEGLLAEPRHHDFGDPRRPRTIDPEAGR